MKQKEQWAKQYADGINFKDEIAIIRKRSAEDFLAGYDFALKKASKFAANVLPEGDMGPQVILEIGLEDILG